MDTEHLGFELFQEWEYGFSYKRTNFILFCTDKRKYLNNKYNRCNIGLNHLAFRCQTKDKIDQIRKNLIQRNIVLLYDDKYQMLVELNIMQSILKIRIGLKKFAWINLKIFSNDEHCKISICSYVSRYRKVHLAYLKFTYFMLRGYHYLYVLRQEDKIMEILEINPISVKKRMTELLFDYLIIIIYPGILFLCAITFTTLF